MKDYEVDEQNLTVLAWLGRAFPSRASDFHLTFPQTSYTTYGHIQDAGR